MYNIDEIKAQNQQDAWSLLYLCFCQEMSRSFGLEGERMIRETIRRTGEWQGKRLKQKHIERGIGTNLLGLFRGGCGACYDPRTKEVLRVESEQVRLWEIYGCPMADFWKKRNAAEFGSYYCEEYLYALMKAYTNGRGQINIGKKMTCNRDTHCQISAYYRPANADENQRKESFEVSCDWDAVEKIQFQDYIKEKMILLCTFFHQICSERHKEEGEAAFSRALRDFAGQIVPVIRKHADDTLHPCDKEFLQLNFPLSLETQDDQLWTALDAERAAYLTQRLVLNVFKEEFQIA